MIRDQGSKNHHYLPQFYINKFRNEQNKVWVFDFESFNQYSNKSNNFSYLKFIREKSSKSFAYIENDNTLFNLKRVGINDYPEQELAKYEKEVSILLDKVVKYNNGDKFPLPGIEWPKLYTFFLSLQFRNPGIRKQLFDLYENQFIDLINLFPIYSNPKINYAINNKKQYLISKLKLSGNLDNIMKLSLPSILMGKLTQDKVLYNKHMDDTYIFAPINAGNFEFLGTDTPVFANYFYLETGTFDKFFIPINPQLIIYNNLNINKENMISLNLLSIANANRYIFSKTKKILEVYLQYYFEYKNMPKFSKLGKLEFKNELFRLIISN
jgi:hypothetical protein